MHAFATSHASGSVEGHGNTASASTESRTTTAIDLPFDIPDFVRPYLTTVSDPASIYSNVHAQRDRRLRLLIRRYVNQIQYGCKNTNCKVPTCLSYRKRKIKAPLRKYTELSARTLACTLIEDLQQQGHEVEAGLCRSEPVVPWYEDPSTGKIRRNHGVKHVGLEDDEHHRANSKSTKSSSRRGSVKQSHSEVGRPLSQEERPELGSDSNRVKQRTQHASQNGVVRNDAKDTAMSDTCPQQSEAQRVPSPGHALEDYNDIAHKSDATISNDLSTYTNDSPLVANDSQSQILKKDVASFTQCVFDMLPLRLLGWPLRPPDTDLQQADGLDENETRETTSAGSDTQKVSSQHLREIIHSHANRGTTTQQHVYSLNLLPHNVMVWLKQLLAAEASSKAESTSASQQSTSVEQFARQSLFYCISDPIRLLNTASNWNRPDGFANGCASEDTLQNRDTTEGAALPSADRALPCDLPQSSAGNVEKTRLFNTDSLLVNLAALMSIQPQTEVVDYMHTALQSTFVLPEVLENRTSRPNTPTTVAKHCSSSREVSLGTTQTANLCTLALLTIIVQARPEFEKYGSGGLISRRPVGLLTDYGMHAGTGVTGLSYPALLANEEKDEDDILNLSARIQVMDMKHDWHVLRLVESVAHAISHWAALRMITSASSGPLKQSENVPDIIISQLLEFRDPEKARWQGRPLNAIALALVDLLRHFINERWDRVAVIRRIGAVGGVLLFLKELYRHKEELCLQPQWFHMPFVAEAFDKVDLPTEWLSFRSDNKKTHILSFSFVFEPARLVEYFRGINLETMRKSYESACIVYTNARQFLHNMSIPVYGTKEVLATMRPHMARYFVLTIRRNNVTEDAINQVWRREKQEIMRPLRLRLGFEEGEEGVDHGGVQQEFFRLVFSEALHPDYGMFTIDEQTRMTWFQPGSLEPLYKFEALGVLFSLAVYNAVTLPVNFPLAFYRKLLGLKVKKLEHISDAWPDLAKNLQVMLDWSDGDVGDAISRTYEFSYEAFGTTVSIDMQKVGRDDTWPPVERAKGKEKAKTTSFELPPSPHLTPSSMSPPLGSRAAFDLSRTPSIDIRGTSTPSSIVTDLFDSEAHLVTNANRAQYVKDYIFWLATKSIDAQYAAFAKGFYTCLDRTALSMFTPDALKKVVEGYQEIDVAELERTTEYEGFTRDSPTIVYFWEIVRNEYTPAQHKQLLEFVTASDRVPVTGVKSIKFEIDRNGEDDRMLPSSSTCYGRLLLPAYSGKEALRKKLTYAIENAVGFGSY